jgi:hypothetical protein
MKDVELGMDGVGGRGRSAFKYIIFADIGP